MPKYLEVEEAAAQFRALIEEDEIKKWNLSINSKIKAHEAKPNEAKTRLLLIDRVLEILGWSKSEFQPEASTTNKTFTDYLLTLDDKPKLIVEAKKFGHVEPLPRTLQKPRYKNSFLYQSCGDELHDLLEQCRSYCADHGVQYALATTGNIWVVMIGFQQGIAWPQLDSYVFNSLEDLSRRFGEFYGLVSRDSVKKNSLIEAFLDMLIVSPPFSGVPRDQITEFPVPGDVPERGIIELFFNQFYGDITMPGQEELLEQCYVPDHGLNEFSREIQQIIEYDPLLGSYASSID
jgi:hypothetical protein